MRLKLLLVGAGFLMLAVAIILQSQPFEYSFLKALLVTACVGWGAATLALWTRGVG